MPTEYGGSQEQASQKLSLPNFIWGLANIMRGPYKASDYGKVILPMTILTRLDAVMKPHRDTMRDIIRTEQVDKSREIRVEDECDGLSVYNTTKFTLNDLLADPDNLKDNLISYIEGFSPNIGDVFTKERGFDFASHIEKLDRNNMLYLIVQSFASVDLHPDRISNAEMGDLFEELIRKFSEAANEDSGEYFTPRDAIKLLVDLLFAEDRKALAEANPIRSIYDPTSGSGGMLSVAEETLLGINPKADLTLYGQELNEESYAISKSDLILKGQSPENIQLGDTLACDHHADRSFDYVMSNPPYGTEWRSSEIPVRKEADELGTAGRFGHGLPAIGDGQLLFLAHCVSKLRIPSEKSPTGGRAGVVMNGSSLFSGAPGGGESAIRQWLFESDLVEAIIALPTDIFYNTGITTYIWIIDNTKHPERKGKVQLIDGSKLFHKLRKGVGSKRNEITEEDRAKFIELYEQLNDADSDVVKIMESQEFGYRQVTVERPLKLAFRFSADERTDGLGIEELITAIIELPVVIKATDAEQRAALTTLLRELADEGYSTLDREEFLANFKERARAIEALKKLKSPVISAIVKVAGERSEDAVVCTTTKKTDGMPIAIPEPDAELRDTENIPLSEDVEEYFEREVLPYSPDAWIDHSKDKIGYEVAFNKYFYKYQPPRELREIDADLIQIAGEIAELLRVVESER